MSILKPPVVSITTDAPDTLAWELTSNCGPEVRTVPLRVSTVDCAEAMTVDPEESAGVLARETSNALDSTVRFRAPAPTASTFEPALKVTPSFAERITVPALIATP